DRTNEEGSHSDGNQRKLPDSGGHSEMIAFAQIQCVSDEDETEKQQPGGRIREPLPPSRTKLFDRGQRDAKDQWIKPRPRWVINPGLKAAEGETGLGQ